MGASKKKDAPAAADSQGAREDARESVDGNRIKQTATYPSRMRTVAKVLRGIDGPDEGWFGVSANLALHLLFLDHRRSWPGGRSEQSVAVVDVKSGNAFVIDGETYDPIEERLSQCGISVERREEQTA